MAETRDTTKRFLGEPLKNIAHSLYDEYVEANVRFRTRSGMKSLIIRRELSKCCDWCHNLAGIYEYGKEPKEVYQRHDSCRCMVTFRNEEGKYEDVWSKKEFDAQELQNEILARTEKGSRINVRQIEIFKKYGTEENIYLFATQEDQAEWSALKEAFGFDTEEAKKYIYSSMKSEEWEDVIDGRVLGKDKVAEDLERQLLKEWDEALELMSDEEESALRFWTSNEYARISEHCRINNGSTEIREKTQLIESALDKFETKDTMIVRRGVGNHRLHEILKKVDGWENDSSRAIGADYEESSFIATTPFKNGAYGGRHQIYFKVPPGTKGGYIKNISHADSELEFLMQKGTKGRIVNIIESEPDRWGEKTYKIFVEIT